MSAKGEEIPLVGTEDASHKWKVPLAMITLVSVAVFKTQITAQLFHEQNYPTAYSMLSCVVTCALLVPIFIVFRSQWQMVDWKMLWPDLLIVVAFTALDLGFSNIALAELSTALFQCIAACNPALTVVLESVVNGKMQHWVIYVVVLGLVVGAIFAQTGDNGERYSTYGIIAAIIQVTCSSSKYVFAHGILKKHKGGLSSLSLLFWLDLFMIPFYIVWTLINGELIGFFITDSHSLSEWFMMINTAGLGGIRALTQFVVLAFVSATSMSAANIFTQILNILISLPIQHTPLTTNLITGICFTITTSGLYYMFKNYPAALEQVDKTCPLCAGRPRAIQTDKAIP